MVIRCAVPHTAACAAGWNDGWKHQAYGRWSRDAEGRVSCAKSRPPM